MTTPILNMVEMAASQSQPQVVVNEIARALEVFGQLVAIDMDQNTPPGSPVDGDVYILGSNPSGLWSAFDDFSIVYYSSGWENLPARHGFRVFNTADEIEYWYDENSSPPWTVFATPGGVVDAAGVTYTQATSPAFSPAATSVADALDDIGATLDALDEWIQELRTIGVPYAQPGLPGASAEYNVMIPYRMEIPAGLVGTRAYRGVAPTAAATFTLYKNGVSFGTIVYNIGVGIVLTAATRTEFTDGDRLTIIAPTSQDATLSNVGFTIRAYRVVD